MNFKVLAIAGLMTIAPMIVNAQEATVMEIVTFQAQKNATDKAVTAALEPIAEKMGHTVRLWVAQLPRGLMELGRWSTFGPTVMR